MPETMSCQFENLIIKAIEDTGKKVKKFNLHPTIDGKCGYLSEILFATFLEESHIDNVLEEQEIILKRVNCNIGEFALSNKIFLNEKYFYEVIIPAFRKFHVKHKTGIKLDFIPEYYGSLTIDNYSFLIMKNLKKAGYDLWDRTKPMTLDIIKKVLSEYGVYHGTSLALKAQNPALFEKLTSGLFDTYTSLITKLDLQYSYQNMKKVIELYRDKPEIYKKLIGLENRINDIWSDKTERYSPYSVITHGDCWNNNYLLKLTDSIQVKMLDFQMMHIIPPVYDLTYYLFAVASANELQHFDEMLKVYYDSLSETVRKLGDDINILCPFDALLNEFKIAALFDLIHSHSFIKASLTEETELSSFDVDKLECGKVCVVENFLYDLKNSEEYYRRCQGIIDFCLKQNVI